jgi:hypothetical protein
VLIVLVIACLGAVAAPSTASAGQAGLDVDLASPVEPLTFDATLVETPCDPGTWTLQTILLDGTPIEPVSVTEDPGDPNTAFIVLPSDTTPGNLLVTANCESGGNPGPTVTDLQEWAAIPVTKVVEGEAPADATFVVNVDCVGLEIGAGATGFEDGVSAADLPFDFDVDLSYGATGGLAFVYTDHGVECTITEPETGGAVSTTIDPEAVTVTEVEFFPVTVTNTFPAPIVVEPTFTG